MSDLNTVSTPAAVICSRPLPSTDAHKCEFTLNIGIFFDGTDNNRHTEPSKSTNTNIVRLWEAYREAPQEGQFRYYVSGVGTPFTEIDEAAPPSLAGATGAGGEERIVYGLLQTINAVHGFGHGGKLRFDDAQLAALCSSTTMPRNNERLSPNQQILQALDLPSGLVGHRDLRQRFIRAEASKLTQQLQATRTLRIKAIYLDVFGFSRGAAQARVFVSWLHDLMLSHGELFGAKSCVRMLGLFDTVSSVGPTNAVGFSGHSNWALASDLPIHSEVKNCVHYVALHELRSNFPSDSIGVGLEGKIPEGCHELFCPGAHSDVGGGPARMTSQRDAADCGQLVPFNNPTKRSRSTGWIRRLHRGARNGLMVFATATLMAGCSTTSSDLVPDEKTMGMSVTAVSHYGRRVGIPEYYVGNFYGGNSSGWGGGGSSSCCVLVPATITKPVMVKVRWKTYRGDVDEERWHEVTVPINFAVRPGGSSGLYVHFLPGHQVEIWVTPGYPEGANYPGPIFPRGPAPTYVPQPGEKPSKLPLPPESN